VFFLLDFSGGVHAARFTLNGELVFFIRQAEIR
jgi:hypothetical protein